MERMITSVLIDAYSKHLVLEEKSELTIKKYLRDIIAFGAFVKDEEITKETVIRYKQKLSDDGYALRSVNSVIASLNSLFDFSGWSECRVRSLKIQKEIFCSEEKEISKAEYERLVRAAQRKGNERLCLLMQTICATGIRISELRYIDMTAVQTGQAIIRCKGKMRMVFLPKQLCKMLKEYIRRRNITSGSVFQSKNGRPLDRSNIWSDMKKLCDSAGVPKGKVFPHNLRHLFARTYYALHKDVVRLADILGHSSVNTTRLYTIESGTVHQKQIQMLGLLLC